MTRHLGDKHAPGTFSAWAARQRCEVCRSPGVELHHVAIWLDLPRKTHSLREFNVMSLCPRCHRLGRHAAHRWVPRNSADGTGQHGWAAFHRLDIESVLTASYRRYAASRGITLPVTGSREMAETLHALM